jgi:hypothetical protein
MYHLPAWWRGLPLLMPASLVIALFAALAHQAYSDWTGRTSRHRRSRSELKVPQPSVLRNRTVALGMLILCIYGALPSSLTTFRFGTAPPANERDLVSIFGLLFATFITISIAIRSRFIGDRVVFGLVAVTFVLRGITLFLPSASSGASVILELRHVVSGAAALSTLVFLISASGADGTAGQSGAGRSTRSMTNSSS